MTLTRALTAIVAALLTTNLSGCGGDSSSTASAAPPVTDNSGVRGSLIVNPPPRVLSLDTSGVTAQVATFGVLGTQLAGVAGAPRCGIDVHHFEYATVGAAGEKTTASGALMVPTGSDPACTGSRPLMMYAHGSSEVHGVDMTALTPQAPYGVTSIEIAALFVAQGWIVIAPNYAGYDTSTLNYHSHHIADQESKDMIDALAAARKSFAKLQHPVTDNGKLFLTGHSEGGYVTMATLRAMQQAGIAVTAAAPSSGNYAESMGYEALVGTPGALLSISDVVPDDILKYAMQFTAWQKADGDLYQSPTEIYPAGYAPTMETIGPNDTPAATLVAQGRLPAFLLANDEPGVAALSPARQALFGAPDQSLIKTSFLQAAIADAAANPCPATSTTEPLACTPANPVRKAWHRNDLRTFAPTVPLLMCGGHGDTEVDFANTTLTYAYFQNHGAGSSLLAPLDVDSAATAGDPWTAAKAAFVSARNAVIAAGGDPSSTDNYHFLAQAACGVAARDFFKTFQ
ncbi:alpha/beta hydrolase family protein [Scleromatobacter humisilvae]|uniref:Prolyl oligopeptidase family serine peptidase n=1 Tax=Scleromatobacter humisilvae TaxID=2897159 RepID=A0A9X1YKV1_9BURK|nr:prolyl oligopeptidase family serine peptidase [Scleromatobacter humisilvae]MCK9688169.1 prolyl oligopeptidase family serine peptidase [Scleromatobacter humisilvae]